MVVFAVGYVSCRISYPTYTHRYRLTLEVKVDDKIRRGSGVIEAYLTKEPKFLPEMRSVSTGVRGDAIPIDLGQGRYLFAILAHGARGSRSYHLQRLALRIFKIENCGRHCNPWKKIGGMAGKRAVPPTHLPTLVTFTDVNDPKTVEVVFATIKDGLYVDSPRKIVVDRFDEVFGGKVQLHKAWIELTKDPITRGIEKTLPWLITRRKELTAMRRKYKRFRFTPGYGHFRIGG